ncbi:MAG: hypothetical protein ACKVOU_05130 [Cytophagales bacterium]
MQTSISSLQKDNYISIIKNKVPDLVSKISASQTPSWGLMSAQHMVEHLAHTVIFSTIVVAKERTAPNKQQEEIIQTMLYSDAEFPQNLMNPMYKDGLPACKFPTIAVAHNQLVKNIDIFFRTFQQHPNGFSFNPFFGDMDYEQLLILHVKHFRHHLKQFGAVL